MAARPVDEPMNLRVQPAQGASPCSVVPHEVRVVQQSPLGVAWCSWRTDVGGDRGVHRDRPVPQAIGNRCGVSMVNIGSHVPSSTVCRHQVHTVCQGPSTLGRSRQGIPHR